MCVAKQKQITSITFIQFRIGHSFLWVILMLEINWEQKLFCKVKRSDNVAVNNKNIKYIYKIFEQTNKNIPPPFHLHSVVMTAIASNCSVFIRFSSMCAGYSASFQIHRNLFTARQKGKWKLFRPFYQNNNVRNASGQCKCAWVCAYFVHWPHSTRTTHISIEKWNKRNILST